MVIRRKVTDNYSFCLIVYEIMIKYVWNLHLEESMLVKFKVTGFKNFEKELVLDLSNPGKYDFNTDLVKNKTINKGII